MSTVVLYDSVGVAEEQRGLLAEALASKGVEVTVASADVGSSPSADPSAGSIPDGGGVRYVPCAEHPKDSDAVVVWGHSAVPSIATDRIVVAATSVPERKYNSLNPLLCHSPLVCMTEWHAKQFAFARDKRVISPILPAFTPREPRARGVFLYASPPEQGLSETLKAWAAVAREWPEAHLELATSTNEYFADAPPRITWLGRLSIGVLVKKLQEVDGLFTVSVLPEAFSMPAALAELSGARCHILTACGVSGLAESIGHPQMIEKTSLGFLKRFEAAWDNPTDPKWYATEIKDRGANTIAQRWMEVLFG